MYTSHSMTLCKLLHLHKPQAHTDWLTPEGATPGDLEAQRVVAEHRKRLWWQSYCMNQTVATELGVPAVEMKVPTGLDLPTAAGLHDQDLDQFFDPHVFTAHIQLCEIKRDISEIVVNLLQLTNHEQIQDALEPSMMTLRKWKDGLPPHLFFEFEDGMPASLFEQPCARGIASLYLRYHQVGALVPEQTENVIWHLLTMMTW
jgi:proline utilization trans-activator